MWFQIQSFPIFHWTGFFFFFVATHAFVLCISVHTFCIFVHQNIPLCNLKWLIYNQWLIIIYYAVCGLGRDVMRACLYQVQWVDPILWCD